MFNIILGIAWVLGFAFGEYLLWTIFLDSDKDSWDHRRMEAWEFAMLSILALIFAPVLNLLFIFKLMCDYLDSVRTTINKKKAK